MFFFTAWAEGTIALLGAILGLWLWPRLGSKQRWLVVFLWISGECEMLEGYLRILHQTFPTITNNPIGNFWKLSVVVVLFSILVVSVKPEDRDPVRALQWLFIAGWAIWFLALGHLKDFDTYFYGALCFSAIVISLRALWEVLNQRAPAAQNPGTWIALATLMAFTCDVLPNAASFPWLERAHAAQKLIWGFRNVSWGIAYAMMAYALTLEETHG